MGQAGNRSLIVTHSRKVCNDTSTRMRVYPTLSNACFNQSTCSSNPTTSSSIAHWSLHREHTKYTRYSKVMAFSSDLPLEALCNIFHNLREAGDRFSFTRQLFIVAAVSKTWHASAFETLRQHYVSCGCITSHQSDATEWNLAIDGIVRDYMFRKRTGKTFMGHYKRSPWLEVLDIIGERDILGLKRVRMGEMNPSPWRSLTR